jgi:hypothetical protein
MNAVVSNPLEPIADRAPLSSHSPPREKRKITAFVMVNVLLALGAIAGFAFNPDVEGGLAAYVLLLGVACAAPLLAVKSFRGRATLLFIFQGLFFVFFGLSDWVGLMIGAMPKRATTELLTGGEVAILLTSLCFSAGYAFVAMLSPPGLRGWMSRDWSPRAIGIMGIVFWIVGFLLSLMFIGGNDMRRATSTGFAMLGGYSGVAVLFTYLLPIGDMCMIYLYLRWKSRAALAALVLMFACEFVLGFLSSAKEFAFRGIVLFLISVLFLKGKLPVRALIVGFILAIITFSFFQDMRTTVARQGRMDLGALWEKLATNPNRTFGSDNSVETRLQRGAEYFASRGNLKSSVELAVGHTGVDVPFQNGKTLEPILYTFVPRAWMPDKADGRLGLLFNKEFRVTVVRTVYIAAGQNGELYWNFGWQGLVVGMLLMGALMGALNVAFDLKQNVTLPRFLAVMLAAYLLAFRFEAGIADQYSLWLRAFVLLLLIHAFMPKIGRGTAVGAPGAPA